MSLGSRDENHEVDPSGVERQSSAPPHLLGVQTSDAVELDCGISIRVCWAACFGIALLTERVPREVLAQSGATGSLVLMAHCWPCFQFSQMPEGSQHRLYAAQDIVLTWFIDKLCLILFCHPFSCGSLPRDVFVLNHS